MARIRREQSAVRVVATTVEPGRSGAMTSVNGLTMSGKRDHKFDEKKRVRDEKVIENGTIGLDMADATIRAEGKLVGFKYKFK